MSLPGADAAQSAFIRRCWLVLLITWPLPLLAEASGLDVILENYYFSPVIRNFPWRDVFWFNVVAHDGIRTLMVFIATIVLMLLTLSLLAPTHLESLLPPFWRKPRVLAYLLAAVLAGPAIITVLKLATTRQCPWHLSMYGGDAFYSTAWDASLFNWSAPGRCFPGSHASGGFALLGFVPLLAGQRRIFMIFFSLLLGMGMGWTRMMQGAHFLSHNLWSAWVCWAAVLLAYAFFQPLLQRQRSHHESKICQQD